uniref:ribosomal RNA processing protein 1 homolog A-like n=1 Tax=Styela clava TaxID=7725 RepID=UPI001939A8D8|nr:ribosomal RNA processing protein 1 homolog A-like [Styela clava]
MAVAPASIEAEFARRLAGNDKRCRDKALKKLRQFLNLRSAKTDGGFTRIEMLSIWKGLFYCMWMSDKPLVQEDLANKISDLLPGLSNIKTAMLFFDTFLETMQREWKGIDRLRMDKFYLLVRCVLRKAFEFLKTRSWDAGNVDWLLAILKNGPICPTKPVSGMQYHFSDIYLEELSKICKDELDSQMVLKFLDPYCIIVASAKNYDIVNAVATNVFQELVDNSKPALELLAEEEVTINVKGHTQTESYDSSPITALNVDYSGLADRLFELASQDGVLARNRKKVFRMVEKFRELAQGRVPLSDVPDAEYSSEDEVKMLEEDLANKIISESRKEMEDKRDYRKTKRRKRKRQIEDGVNSDDDLMVPTAIDVKEDIDANTSESLEDFEDSSENVDTNNNQSSMNVNTTKKKKKKKKIEQKTIIIGSNLGKESSSSTSEQDINSTVSELLPKKKKDKKKAKMLTEVEEIAKTEPQPSENIPDILQDIQECKQALVKKLKRKDKLKSKKQLKVWLDSATHNSQDQESRNDSGKQDNPTIVCSTDVDGHATNDNIEPLSNIVQKPSTAKSDNHEKPALKKRKKKRKSLSKPEVVNETDLNLSTNSNEISNENDIIAKSPSVTNSKKKKQKSEALEEAPKSDINTSETKVPKKKNKSNDAITEGEKFAQILNTNSVPAMSTFFKVAASKVDRAKKNKHNVAVKRKIQEPVAAHSPKRVVFEMSKTQIQPFRKFDKSTAVSASPGNVAFDPRKTPDFGLLKKGRNQKRKSAADFF